MPSIYPINEPSTLAAMRNLGRGGKTGIRTIDSGMAFLEAELEKMDTKIREPLTSVTWDRDIVAKTGGGWVEYTSMTNVDYASVGGNSNGIIGGQTNAIPVMQADIGKDMFKVFTFGHVLKVPFVDQAKLQKIGRSLEDLLDKGIKLNYQKSLDQNVYEGYSNLGSEGIMNNSKIASASASNGAAGTKTWKTKTADEILADVNEAITTVWQNCEYAMDGMPNHILIPPQQYAYIVNQKVSEAGNISILNYLLENNIAVNQGQDIQIYPSRWCIGAGAGQTDRMLVYVNDEDKLYFDITVPLQRVMTQPSVSDMAYLTAYAAQHGEVKFAYHETALYVDGI